MLSWYTSAKHIYFLIFGVTLWYLPLYDIYDICIHFLFLLTFTKFWPSAIPLSVLFKCMNTSRRWGCACVCRALRCLEGWVLLSMVISCFRRSVFSRVGFSESHRWLKCLEPRYCSWLSSLTNNVNGLFERIQNDDRFRYLWAGAIDYLKKQKETYSLSNSPKPVLRLNFRKLEDLRELW